MAWVARAECSRWLLVWMGLIVATVGVGCDCSSDGPTASLVILEPEEGQTLGLGEDEDPSVEGIQFTVTVLAKDIDVSEEVGLFFDPDAPADAAPDVVAFPESSGSVVFPRVTLPLGAVELQARARIGAVRSDVRSFQVSDGCAGVNFVTPAPPGEDGIVQLGATDDEDSEACGSVFTTSVVVSTTAGDGRAARLFVNENPQGVTNVMGTVARFEGVVLDNRGDAPNTISVEVENTEGATCRQAFPGSIFVDCDGTSCALTTPSTGTAFLNQSDDTSADPGFQTTFAVTTGDDGAGRPVRLIVDGNETDARTATSVASGSGGVAAFGNVALTEGLHRIQAECVDALGNRTRSGTASWTVDITPCTVAIDQPTEGQTFVDTPDMSSDVDPVVDGVQIETSGTASGAGCQRFRVATCAGLEGRGFFPFDGSSWQSTITLSSAGTQAICANVQDEAGNLSLAQVGIALETTAPELAIVTPTEGTRINRLGTEFPAGTPHMADLDSTTPACNLDVVVACSELGVPVTLHETTLKTTLASADCVAVDAGPLAGEARFDSVALPLGVTSPSLVARQQEGVLIGSSETLVLAADCQSPALQIGAPTCGGTLSPVRDDTDPATPGLQRRVTVNNPNQPAPNVTVTILNGTTVVDQRVSLASSRVNGTFHFLDGMNFGNGGVLDVTACGTDGFGNEGCSAECKITVADLPSLAITAPRPNQVFNQETAAAADCDGGTPGFQLLVTGTTDATDGSEVRIGADGASEATTTVSGGRFSACVAAPDNSSLVIRVTVSESGRGESTGSVRVIVDTRPPPTPIDDLTAQVLDRRGGSVQFGWTAVADEGGAQLRQYLLRCASTPITTEADWQNAEARTVTTTPGASGTPQQEQQSGFRVGLMQQCVLRGVDAAGNRSPLPAESTEVQLSFLEHILTQGGGGQAQFGLAVTAIGDVNGDGLDDALITGLGVAYVYFGAAGTLSSSVPDVIIQHAVSASGFAAAAAGLGDFNGDGRDDFALSAWNEGPRRGAVFVFFGKTQAMPWPGLIQLSGVLTSCEADLCFRSDDGVAGGPDEGASFGYALASAGDFNGDGLADLLIGAPEFFDAAPDGRVYVLLGAGYAPGSNVSVPGPADPTMQPAGFVIDGPVPPVTAFFGNAVAPLGDISGDGRAEVVIQEFGAPASSEPAHLFRVSGRAYGGNGLETVPSGSVVEVVTDATLENGHGTTVATAGDFNGDGRIDLAAVQIRPQAAGGVTLYLGLTGANFLSSSSLTVTGNVSTAGDEFGISGFLDRKLAAGFHPTLKVTPPGSGPVELGDIDRDGMTELFIGSREQGSSIGSAQLFYGRAGTADIDRNTDAQVVTFQPPGPTTRIRRTAGFVGDLNGDGFPDLAVGDPEHADMDGRVFIHY